MEVKAGPVNFQASLGASSAQEASCGEAVLPVLGGMGVGTHGVGRESMGGRQSISPPWHIILFTS